MPKHSPYKQRVNEIIGRVVAGGFIDRWLTEMNENAERANRQVIVNSEILHQGIV